MIVKERKDEIHLRCAITTSTLDERVDPVLKILTNQQTGFQIGYDMLCLLVILKPRLVHPSCEGGRL
jgi:hypothetical protein